MVQIIPVGDQWALVDDEDYERVAAIRWKLSARGYACGGPSNSMHRFIMGSTTGDGIEYDHANRNKLDNRRCNLRVATRAQNRANMTSTVGKSRFKGVHPNEHNAWIARCGQVYLGCYLTEEDAARAYNRAARERYGEFALLNDVDDLEPERIIQGVRRRKTHCPSGHLYIRKDKYGHKICQICDTARKRRAYHASKDKLAAEETAK